jgi:hypothetical protein
LSFHVVAAEGLAVDADRLRLAERDGINVIKVALYGTCANRSAYRRLVPIRY